MQHPLLHHVLDVYGAAGVFQGIRAPDHQVGELAGGAGPNFSVEPPKSGLGQGT